MKDKMLFSMAMIPLCFYLLHTMSSASVLALSLFTIVFAVFVIMQVNLIDYSFKYGKPAGSRKLRKELEAMLLKSNMAVLFLFIGVCMMFVYGRDAEWIRFLILLFSGSAAVVMAAYLDVNKGKLVFKTAKKA